MNKKKVLTIAIFVFGVLIFGLSHSLKQVKISIPDAPLSLEQVNSIDASMAHGYDKTLDDLATLLVILGNCFTCVICFLIPGILALKNKRKLSTVFFEFFVFIEVWIYTRGIYSILKVLVARFRPYMYFENQDLKGIAEGDFFRSWPSGHSASAFLATGFLISWLFYSKMSPAIKKIAILLSVIVSAETAVLRVLSGNHFFTDVVSGSILGLVIGIALFAINKKNVEL